MGMKNLKGGEVCSTTGGRIPAEGIYTHAACAARGTTANCSLSMSLLCNGLQYSFVLEWRDNM